MPAELLNTVSETVVCLNYCFRACLAYLFPVYQRVSKAQKVNAVSLELPKSGERGYMFSRVPAVRICLPTSLLVRAHSPPLSNENPSCGVSCVLQVVSSQNTYCNGVTTHYVIYVMTTQPSTLYVRLQALFRVFYLLKISNSILVYGRIYLIRR